METFNWLSRKTLRWPDSGKTTQSNTRRPSRYENIKVNLHTFDPSDLLVLFVEENLRRDLDLDLDQLTHSDVQELQDQVYISSNSMTHQDKEETETSQEEEGAGTRLLLTQGSSPDLQDHTDWSWGSFSLGSVPWVLGHLPDRGPCYSEEPWL